MTDDAYAMGERIAADRRSLRALRRAFCPKDGRLIAAVYAVDGVEWLWLAGGRAGSHAEFVKEFERSRDDAQADLNRARARGDADWEARALDAVRGFTDLLDEIVQNHYPAAVPPTAYRVDDLRSKISTLGPWSTDAVCPGCRRNLRVTIDGGGVLSAGP